MWSGVPPFEKMVLRLQKGLSAHSTHLTQSFNNVCLLADVTSNLLERDIPPKLSETGAESNGINSVWHNQTFSIGLDFHAMR